MNDLPVKEDTLVTIVIACYNHGHYLNEALDSILKQTYPAIEIIVVNDGSIDNTKEVTELYPQVKHIYQTNQGLSAARNTGIKHSTGECLIFLDADDWLTPGAIERNLIHLQQDESLGFVSGGHYKMYHVYEENATVVEEMQHVGGDYYVHLLHGNYIGMASSVMFRRWVFEDFLFDTTLKACEDYDLYLRIARKYPVFHHMQMIGAYRMRSDSMSTNGLTMLVSVMQVLDAQKKDLRTPAELEAYQNGRKTWIALYSPLLYQDLVNQKTPITKTSVGALLKYNPKLGWKFVNANKPYFLKLFLNKAIGR